LLFPLEDSIKEYYHHTEEETKGYEPCTIVFNPRITKHYDLRSKGVENGVACNLAEGFLSGVCFALSEMGVVGDGGGFYRRATLTVVLRCGVAVMDHVTRGSKHEMGRGDGVAGGDGGGGCAAKGVWAVVVRCKGAMGRW
jgi:hypothetical protein